MRAGSDPDLACMGAGCSDPTRGKGYRNGACLAGGRLNTPGINSKRSGCTTDIGPVEHNPRPALCGAYS